jgi:tetratricopeptide (TPR) repeat protein
MLSNANVAPRDAVQTCIEYYRLGRFFEAKRAIGPLLEQYPNDPYIFNIHAATLLQLGSYDEAVQSAQRAIELRPDYIEAQGNLASAYFELSDLERAEAVAAQILATAPVDMTGLIVGAECALSREDKADAEAKIAALQKHHRLSALTWSLSAKLHRLNGSLTQALQSCRDSLSIDSGRESVVVLYIGLLIESTQLKEAEQGLVHALRAWPKSAAITHLSAQLRVAKGEIAEAVAIYEGLLTAEFRSEIALNLASLYRQTGAYPAALAVLWQVLGSDGGNAQALLGLSQMPLDEPDRAKALSIAERLAVQADLNPTDRGHLNYALGALYAGQRLYKKAFIAYQSANLIRAQQHPYDVAYDRRLMRSVMAYYQAIEQKDLKPLDIDTQPVFIVGLPRSGSTLLEQRLLEYDDVVSMGELEFLNRSLGIWLRDQATEDDTHSQLRKILSDYRDLITSTPKDARIILDKLPLNYRWVGLISAVLPKAKFIWLDKAPLAACWSLYKQQFAGYEFSYQFETLAEYMAAYIAYKSHWQTLMPEKIFFIDYERWMDDPNTVDSRVVRFLGLAPTSTTFQGAMSGRYVNTLSSAQVREPITARFTDEWQHYQSELKPLEILLKSALGSNFGKTFGE